MQNRAQAQTTQAQGDTTAHDSDIEKGLQAYLLDGSYAGQRPDKAIPAKLAAAQALSAMPAAAPCAASLRAELAAKQRTTLTGKTANTADELAALAQIYRNPNFETFRLVFTDESGSITSQIGVTCRMPASTATAVGADQDAFIAQACANAARMGASRAYMLHNHPSGDPTPSNADILTTQRLAPLVQQHLQFQGHVVIDTDRYCVISGSGNARLHALPTDSVATLNTPPSWDKVKVRSPQALMTYAKQLQISSDHITLITTVGSSGEVTNVVDIPCSATEGPQGKVRSQLLRIMLTNTADRLHAISPNQQALERVLHTVSTAILANSDGTHTTIAQQDNKIIRRARVSPDTTPDLLTQATKTIMVDGVARPTTNSFNHLIHPSEQGTINFWRWFGNSKTVDSHGRPIPLYHGTDADFDTFDPSKRGQKDHGFYGSGFYHSADPQAASAYATFDEDNTDGPNVMANYVRLLNPYVWQDQPVTAQAWSATLSEQITQDLIAQGHDGVIVPYPAASYEGYEHSTMHEVIAYSPEQIKSATGNSGDFDTEKESINEDRPPLEAPTDSSKAKAQTAPQEEINAAIAQAITAEKAWDELHGMDPLSIDIDQFMAVSEQSRQASRNLVNALAKTADANLALQAQTSDGRALILTASAQQPGKWQLTRFDTQGEPWGDTNYNTKEQAIGEFIEEADLATLVANNESAPNSTNSIKDQAQTEAFKSWFGDSKVVDASGKPLVVYHGTAADNLFVFNPRASVEIYGRPEGIDAIGSWFTTDPVFSENFGDKRVDAYLSIKNPAVFDSWDELMDQWSDENTSKHADKAAKAHHKANRHNGDAKAFMELLIAEGFDGIQIKPHKTNRSSEFDGRAAWIAFRPEQIKSAIGNNGDFDRNKPSILEDSRNEPEHAHAPLVEVDGHLRAAINSQGNPIHSTIAGIRNFWRWFGNAQSVDEKDRPLVAFHGTKADFTEFKRTRNGEFGPAIYATDSAREASEYGEGKGWGGPSGVHVMPIYVKLNKPYTLGVDQFWKDFGQHDGDAAAIARAKLAGYDGVVAKRTDRYYDNETKTYVDRGDTLTHFVAFDPQQIKSVTGNSGQFRRESQHIVEDSRSARLAGPDSHVHQHGMLEIDGVMRPLVNSANEPIHSTIAGIRNFWRWFADSTNLDDHGRPLVFYHGSQTPQEIHQFKPGGTQSSQLHGDAYGVAAYFSTCPHEASFYAREEGAVIPVYIRGQVLNVDAPMPPQIQNRLSAFANEVMLPQDKARFPQGRKTVTLHSKADAQEFFESHMKNWQHFSPGFERAKPDVIAAKDNTFTIEYTDFDGDIRIYTGEQAFTLFNAIGWDNLPAAGFDGMVMQREGGQLWAVMHKPEGNVKSTLGNRGTFYGHRDALVEDNARSEHYARQRA